MKAKGYLNSLLDSTDSRRTLIRLSDKSRGELPHLEQNWDLIQSVVREFVDDSFLQKLTEIENRLRQESLFERINNQIDK